MYSIQSRLMKEAVSTTLGTVCYIRQQALKSGKPKPTLRIKTARKALPKPRTQLMSPQEWAFKVGTLYSHDMPAPNWNELLANSGHICRALALAGNYCTLKQLDAYFRLGTYCKEGTPYKAVWTLCEEAHATPYH